MEEFIKTGWKKVYDTLNESQKRWFAAQRANEIGHGGISQVSKICGLSRTTITKGAKELAFNALETDKVRKSGGGRKKLAASNKKILNAVESIVDETSAGDPMTMLKWTCKSTRSIAGSLNSQGFNITHGTVSKILKEQGYSLQSNKKMLSDKNHPDRDAQFRHINRTVNKFIKNNAPVISVDTKKKELVGNFKNAGRTWGKTGHSVDVLDHDFKSYSEGVAVPYGTYDIQRNEGFVNVGMSSDTSEFAVNSIWQWWRHFGRNHYPKAEKLLICADGGGSNGSRSRAWKFYLQELSNKIGLSITVCHYPPGTSKWNKIEHKMFSYISMNWKGKPLENYESIVNLIAGTKTKSGLKIKSKLDKAQYKKGQKISDEEFGEINLKFSKKFPLWNYKITPLN